MVCCCMASCCVTVCGCVCDNCWAPIKNKVAELAFDICVTQASYVCGLRTNLRKLKMAISDLKDSRNSVMDLVETVENSGEQRSRTVEDWFGDVEKGRAKAEILCDEGERQRQNWPRKVEVSPLYNAGEGIVSMIEDLHRLKVKGDAYQEKDVASSVKWFPLGKYTPSVEGYLKGECATVGSLEAHKKEVLEYLEGTNVRVVKVRGRAGVGKTTLLDLIIKHFIDMRDSNQDLVIYVRVKDSGVEAVQRLIIERMGFLNDWRNESAKQGAAYICNKLKEKQQHKQIGKFVLLLDDIWNNTFRINDIVGEPEKIPFKVVFTTRRKMDEIAVDETVTVETLKEEHARELFENVAEINKSRTSTRIQSVYVPAVIRLCGGLPSALVKLGKALGGKNEKLWDDMISFLENQELGNDAAKLFDEMKYSYELLDVACKECFLYSCVFLPGDFYIPSHELEDLLIYGDCSNHFKGNPATNEKQARNIIETLSDEGLLETDDKEVKLHHLIRCMGLWLAQDRMVSMGDDTKMSAEDRKKRVVLMKNDLRSNDTFPKDARPNLRTLFVKNIGEFDYDKLFKGVDAVVLKLLGSGVPKCLSSLRMVKYLDISFTEIRKLPKLTEHLRYLNVNGMELEFEGSKRVISKLSSLQVLRMMCRFHYAKKVNVHVFEEQMLEVLKSLERLNVLEIELSTSQALEKLFRDFELLQKIRYLSIRGFKPNECVVDLAKKAGELVELLFTECEYQVLSIIPYSDSKFNKITKVTVENCRLLEELTNLVLLKFLKVLKVSSCADLKYIIKREKLSPRTRMQKHMFLDLALLHLELLPHLEHIYQCCHSGDLPEDLVHCPRSLPLNNLCELLVHECKKLKHLPFGGDRIEGKIQLHASEEWWTGIEKEDNNVGSAWLPRLSFQICKVKNCPQNVNSPRSLPLKKLYELPVHECKKLKQLPFDADRVKGKNIQLPAPEEEDDNVTLLPQVSFQRCIEKDCPEIKLRQSSNKDRPLDEFASSSNQSNV